MITLRYTKEASAAAGREIHRRAESRMRDNGGTYQDAVRFVCSADKCLAGVYTNLPKNPPTTAPVSRWPDPGKEVERRVEALRARNPHLAYHGAMGAVLAADPALKAAYAGVPA
ncbi:MAG: hypothetical protein ACREXX_08905 [Gammaproteobacteria bacterium]